MKRGAGRMSAQARIGKAERERADAKPRRRPGFGRNRRKRIISLHERILSRCNSRVQTGIPVNLDGSGTLVLISISLPSRSL